MYCYIAPHIHIPEIITQYCNTLALVYCSRSSFKVHTDKRYLPVTCHDHHLLLIVCFVGLLIHGLVAYKSDVRNIMPEWHHCVDEAMKYQLLKNTVHLFTTCKIVSIFKTCQNGDGLQQHICYPSDRDNLVWHFYNTAVFWPKWSKCWKQSNNNNFF